MSSIIVYIYVPISGFHHAFSFSPLKLFLITAGITGRCRAGTTMECCSLPKYQYFINFRRDKVPL